jgi:hypothetical protein
LAGREILTRIDDGSIPFWRRVFGLGFIVKREAQARRLRQF